MFCRHRCSGCDREVDGASGAVEAGAWRAGGDCCLHRVIERYEGFFCCSLKRGDYGRARKKMGIGEVCPCCYRKWTTRVL